MRKILFIFAAMLLGSIGLHAGNTITYTAPAQLSRSELNVGATTFGPAITSHTFSNGKGTITCSGEITTIGQAAFSRCGLTSITIPNSVTQIGAWAFEFCSNLQNINLPSSIKSIDVGTFQWAGLTSIIIPASVERIENFAFWACPLEYVACMSKTPPALGDEATFPDAKKALVYVPSQDAINAYKNSDWSKYFTNIIIKTITYTATAKLPGYEGSLDVGATTFGAPITDHTFSNGTGTIACAGEITQIGEDAFRQCSNLSSVTIPNSVTEIGMSAFNESGLTSIEIPSSVTSIEEYAFMYCRSLSSVTIPNSIKILPMSTFLGCTSLKSIEIPSSVTTIGSAAFWKCKNLTSITIPNSVTTIGNEAFADVGLTSITIPASVKEIDEQAFWNCTGLTSVTVSWTDAQSIVSINSNVFQGIANGAGPSGATLHMPKGTYNLYNQANVWKDFGNFKPNSAEVGDLRYEFFDGNKARVIAKEDGYTGNVVIPEQVTYKGVTFTVTEIGQHAFQDCTNLTSITIPNSVTTIGEAAFSRCSGLTSITIPNSVTQIGAWAFENCNKLQNIDLPSSIRSIDVGTFQWAGLTSITIPASVERIENFAFWACPLEYVISMSETPPALGNEATFPDAKKALAYVPSQDAINAYKSSSWSKYFTNFITDIEYRVTSPSTVEVISAVPFGGEVTIPSATVLSGKYYQVTGIADSAFYKEDSLVSILLPPTIKYIGANAFDGCTQLKQTNSRFWGDLQTIRERAFYGCSELDSIVIPEGVQTIGKSAFMECRSLKYVSLPGSLRTIPDECFRHCLLGREIVVPEGVETIGAYGFVAASSDTEIEVVITLPSTLKEINYGAFFWRHGLKGVTCLATTPPTLKGQAFAEYKDQKYKDEHITVYVPNRDVMAKYRDDKDQWGSDTYKFKFADLMAEENKEYLRFVAGSNDEAKKIANAYCDSIDQAKTSQDVQRYTNTALGKIDKITLAAYKDKLIDSLVALAGENIEAKQIAEQYAPQIKNAYFRQDAERLFLEAEKKINAIFELIALKENYITQLKNMAYDDPDLQKVAADYGALIQLAETKEQARALYERATMRIEINRQIKNDWTGQPGQRDPLKCSSTRGYINNH